jgi:hypothetical protein
MDIVLNKPDEVLVSWRSQSAMIKECPTCKRTYPGDGFAFCLADGSLLSAPFDSYATRGLPSLTEVDGPVTADPVPTLAPETLLQTRPFSTVPFTPAATLPSARNTEPARLEPTLIGNAPVAEAETRSRFSLAAKLFAGFAILFVLGRLFIPGNVLLLPAIAFAVLAVVVGLRKRK